MKLTRSLIIAIIILLVWCLLTWRIAHAIAPHPPMLYYLRLGFLLLGVIGFVGYILLRPKERGEVQQGWAGMTNTEIEYSFSEASKHLLTVGVKNINTLPSVFILGDTGTAKTSAIAKSGLEPDLLAGYAYEDYVIAPTRALNVWYARQTLYIDPAGAVISEPSVRKKLFQKFAPVRFKSVLGGKQPPPRSVVFTIDCEIFLQHGSGDALAAKARQFQAILSELSQELGANFPVYVLFTKADRINYFREYVSNFTEAEVTEIFGKTLPLQTATVRGIYAEQETKRLTEAFQELYFSLCDRRPEQLSREHNPTQLPNIYEFPREFAKLRPLLVQFLVDLCRPTQLRTSPFLRGFYFTGIRPVSVPDLAPAAVAPIPDEPYDAGATRIFNPRSAGAPRMEAQVRESGSRRVPQWVFLTHLFSDLILVDQPAMVVTQSSTKLDFWRRMLLAGGTALAAFLVIWWMVSFGNNRALVRDAVQAAGAVPSVSLPSGQLASLDSLQRLDKVRRTLAVLNDYERNGAPFSYGGMLYVGESVRQPLRTTYYALFRRLLLSPTQGTMIGVCNNPDQSQAQGWIYIYNTLKGYLMTTQYTDKIKENPGFLGPELLVHWQKGQQVDGERVNLAQEDFNLYAEDAALENPYPRFNNPDANAVGTARAYLNRFAQESSVYAKMLDIARRGLKPLIFNEAYPESKGLIINTYPVDQAFTKDGYNEFFKLLKDPQGLFKGEDWVLGKRPEISSDWEKSKQNLIAQYSGDYIKTWREFLHATRFIGYAPSTQDIASKLGKLTANNSPLLEVVCVASDNTSVKDNKTITDVFQPVQSVTPSPCIQRPNSASNKSYVSALIALQGAVAQIRDLNAPEATSQIAAANTAEGQGENTTRELASSFNRDSGEPKVDVKTTDILLSPLSPIPPILDRTLGAAAAAPINAAAGALCKDMSPMLAKYPFRKDASDATIQEVNQFLKPGDGAFWKLAESMNKLMTRAGDQFVLVPGQSLKVTPGFLAFANRMLHMSTSLYNTGADPNMSFSMEPQSSPDIDHITMVIDGITLSQEMKNPAKQVFQWPGSTQGADLRIRFTGGGEDDIVSTTGLWAIWHFLDTAESWTPVGNQLSVQWTEKTTAGIVKLPNGHPKTVKFMLDPQGSQVFQPRYFAGLGCSSTAVK
ncbi:MAG TPA: type VI secretion protein IcmF/TssM N-terminal domain-containing protein [Bryobacteraceae bacterium]|jgi:type VI secretion system protein ImpL|nr:type VI secretion protein IcmF/TssM N-terminal domain-containing protein [Bryobacteraceae bacterium]